jgi:hypothetical protein
MLPLQNSGEVFLYPVNPFLLSSLFVSGKNRTYLFMFTNIKSKLLYQLKDSLQSSLDRFKSLYYKKGFEYLERSERIIHILKKIDAKIGLDNTKSLEEFQSILNIQEEIEEFLIVNKKELRDEYIQFQVNVKIKNYLESGKIN